MARFVTNGSGFFRTTVFQAGTLAALELRAQLQEDAPGPTLVRSDLLAALRECKAWSLRCIEVGETNIKGYLVMSLLAAQVNCYLAAGDEAVAECDVPMRLVEAAAEIEDECLALLEAMVAPGEATAHAVAQAERAARQQAAEEAVAVDPFVQALVADFGGQVVAGSIRHVDSPAAAA